MYSCATADVDREAKGEQKTFTIQSIQNMYDKCKDFNMDFLGDSKETAYKGKKRNNLHFNKS